MKKRAITIEELKNAKYAIFCARSEVRCDNYTRAWDFVENDLDLHEIKEVFDDLETAKAALKNYFASVQKCHIAWDFYSGEVYYIAEIKTDYENPKKITDFYPADGWEITEWNEE